MDRHLRAKDLFHACCGLEGPQRETYLAASCGEDHALLQEVRDMLAADERHPEFLEPRTVLSSRPLHASLPSSIGGFRILSKLGQGGMGIVYAAEQEKPRRSVALKIIHPFLLSPVTLRRFEQEGEFLGRLQHPGIAQIFESARVETEYGPQPYLAMELVRGVPLTEYADRNTLSPRERLELFALVADAIQHAHQHGVIHRDLKPQNILVDAAGKPKVLDFGIARASNADVQLTTLQTDMGQILGTLPYMSPEQASGDPATIDTRSDVYSLGVILYELLAGKLPFELANCALPEAVRVIREDEPRSLSEIRWLHRGDVETIVRKALEKDKNRRYASAAALAADIRHHLLDQPIEARPPSLNYRLTKFVRRNRTVVAASSIVLLSLLVGLFFSIRFGLDEARQRALVEAQNEEVLKLSALQDLEDLRVREQELWPIHPEDIPIYRNWIEEARALVAKLPEFQSSQRDLRAKALPRTKEERQAQRARHPDYPELKRVAGEIAWRERLLSQQSLEATTLIPEVLGSEFSKDASAVREAAWIRVDPQRREFGEEDRGLALALLALDMTIEASRASALDTLAWAYFAVGRNDEALDTAFAAWESAPEGSKLAFSAMLERLEAAVAANSNEEWIQATRDKLETLEARRKQLESRVDERSDWSFPADEMEGRWWNEQLSRLTQELEELRDGPLADAHAAQSQGSDWSVPRRLNFALSLRDGLAPGGDCLRSWEQASESIRASYPNLVLAPQLGLVPIGADRSSGLWEFSHLATGEITARDAKGNLVLNAETGLVFVLLPGGTYLQGAQSHAPGEPNYDPAAGPREGPPFPQSIAAFFLSKYEMTQGQWLRFTGKNPSYSDSAQFGAPTQPVEQVSWTMCARTLARLGLTLPSEAQWEYGARAGTQTVFWTGDDFSSLQGAANLVDQAFLLSSPGWPFADEVLSWNDGFGGTAPVGTFAPNPFGLHEVHGNVVEWCLDSPYFYREFSGRAGSAEDNSGARFFRTGRGGSFRSTAVDSRSAYRTNASMDTSDYALGLRPARAIDASP